jgi:6-phospho-3-hexuloisomerase
MKNNVIEEVGKVLEKIDDKNYEMLLSHIRKAKRVFLAGAGRSGLIGRCFAMRLMHLGIESHVVGETTCPSIKKGDLLIIVSCSGNNKSLLEFAKTACSRKARVLAITSDNTPVASVSDYAIKIPLVKSVQFGNSLFEQAAFLFLEMFLLVYGKRGKISHVSMAGRHANLE